MLKETCWRLFVSIVDRYGHPMPRAANRLAKFLLRISQVGLSS